MKWVLIIILISESVFAFSQTERLRIYYEEVEVEKEEALPLAFDLRDHNRVSSVRIQPNGGCWASAAMSTIESAWLSSAYLTVELSAINLQLFHAFEDERNTYGNHYMSTAYFTRGSGPQISSPEMDSVYQLKPELPAYISDARYLPNDPDLIKTTIMNIGGVYSMMYFKGSLIDTINYTYYSKENEINHGVMLIGWNDTIPTFKGNGAWLAQNSLGEKFGDHGYCWISYEDENILKYNAVWNGWMDYNPAAQLYYYDTLGSFYSYGFRDSICYGLVKFTAEESIKIEAIGTSINYKDSKIEAHLFKSFDDSLKTLSERIGGVKPMECKYPGYYTLQAHQDLEIKKGEDFYVMMKYTTPNDTLPLPVETYIEGYSNPVLTSGKCWINPDYKKWPDTWFECGADSPYPNLRFNLCIRVFCMKQD